MSRPVAAGTRRPPLALLSLALAVSTLACHDLPSDPAPAVVAAKGGKGGGGSGDVTVRKVTPSDAPRNITIDLTVTGSGFEPGAVVSFERSGGEAAGITTNSTGFRSATELVANVTIETETDAALYDVVVTNYGGKRGVGVERFEVLDIVWLGTPDGERLMRATHINGSGHAVGYSYRAPFYWSVDGGPEWLWDEKYVSAFPMAINDLDAVAGYTCGWVVGAEHPSCGPREGYGVIWQPGAGGGWTTTTVTGVGELPTALTNSGELFFTRYAGSVWSFWRRPPGQTEEQLPVPQGHAISSEVVFANNTGQAVAGDLFWFDPEVSPLVLPAPAGGSAHIGAAIADRAGDLVYVVGSATVSGIRQPVRWTVEFDGAGWTVAGVERLRVSFRTWPYGTGYGRGVNSSGDAVGFVYNSRGTAVPVRWSASGVDTELPHPRSNVNAQALAINNAGWVTGYVEAPYDGAVVWKP